MVRKINFNIINKKGCNINLKSKITDKELNEFFKIENITVINCAGNKKRVADFLQIILTL